VLSYEQKLKIDDLVQKYLLLKAEFPKWNSKDGPTEFFPDREDIKAIADLVQPFAYAKPTERLFCSPKIFFRHLFVRMAQPFLRLLFTRQTQFNEHIWLLANTIAVQNEKIRDLEKKLNDFRR